MAGSLTSSEFPYVPVRVEIRGKVHEGSALVDTGFDGKLIVPANWVTMDIGDPDGQSEWRLADGRVTYAPSYRGDLWLGDDFAHFSRLRCDALGDQYIVGLEIVSLFGVNLDHGERLIFEP